MISSTYDFIVIGCGLAGAVISREIAERSNKKVLIIEKRNHIGGNTYDFFDEEGILVHKYGPHIFHTNNKRVFDYLSRFTKWLDYDHEVVANVYGNLMPVPFNLNSLYVAFEKEEAKKLEEKLIKKYGLNSKLTIAQLREQTDIDLIKLSEYVYKNIFLYYTQKQWDITPLEIDPSVIARVPILISNDNRYFQDLYQGMPLEGYTKLFESLLDHPNIDVQLNVDAKKLFNIRENKIMFKDNDFNGKVIFTGAIDEFFSCKFGRLPYRTLDFLFETHDLEWFQTKGTVNYTVSEKYTRITEFKHLTGQKNKMKTTTVKEFPKAYTGADGETPYYAILNDENYLLYDKYKKLTEGLNNFYLLGRLAEYKYYNMDAIVLKALILADNII